MMERDRVNIEKTAKTPMTPEELEIIEKRLSQGMIKVTDVQKLIDAMRSALEVLYPVGAVKVEEKKEDAIASSCIG